jgi:hypothetical protein
VLWHDLCHNTLLYDVCHNALAHLAAGHRDGSCVPQGYVVGVRLLGSLDGLPLLGTVLPLGHVPEGAHLELVQLREEHRRDVEGELHTSLTWCRKHTSCNMSARE